MAQVMLGGVGAALGGGVGRVIGSALGRVADDALIDALQPARQRGPRLEGLRLQSTAEGAPMACVLGRMRVAGQVIWAARFLESRHENGGGKGGPRTVETAYSLSFAVAVCEGEIDAVERVWADGRLMDLSGVAMRVYRGGAAQTPDPLIEAVEGAAPAYRGTAYVVFEDLPLGAYGNRPPQLSFEVLKRPEGDGLEERLEGVCLIPGAGEFVLATEAVTRREGLTRTRAENVNTGQGGPDILVSLEQLTSQCPNLKRVSLVIGWFGDDLRAGHCRVKPGVESRDKVTEGAIWGVAGLTRANAHLISRIEGAPAYGGTPSDDSVRQAVVELKARGLEVTLYPFVFMDIPEDNDLPGLGEDETQPPYPWRGRIRGEDGPDAAEQAAAIFGGADDWGLRRLARHYAALAAETGADGLLIGSEMRGLTWTRDEAGGYPAVEIYRALAAECRTIAGPDVKLSYAADWSEYFGHQPPGGDVRFHLDPLWADAVIDYVGIDWYPPLTDWRDGDGGLDAEDFSHQADRDYLAQGVAGGEGFDWFYADGEARTAQNRTPIEDTAHGEHWVYRPKDLIGWWSHPHHERIDGVRSSTPTGWLPGMKPIRLTEFGCAAVDRGGNAPNLFFDSKSAESALPPFSTGRRSDRMQRRALEAILAHFATPTNNPAATAYAGRMLEAADAWCWDARPYPAFPARKDVWADASAWRTGHWLNGRLVGDVAAMIAAVLRRGGLGEDDFVIEGVDGEVTGYAIDRPMRTRDALEPLLRAVDAVIAERDGRVAILGREALVTSIEADALALPDEGAAVRADRILEERPSTARVRYIDDLADHQTAAVGLRRETEAGGGAVDMDLPLACSPEQARLAAAVALGGDADVESRTLALGPLAALRFEAGDMVTPPGAGSAWRVERIVSDETPHMVVRPCVMPERGDLGAAESPVPETPQPTGAPFMAILDLPPLPGRETDDRPLAAVAAEPWRAMEVQAGSDPDALSRRARAEAPATVGRLTAALASGVVGRWDGVNRLTVKLEGRAPQSRGEAAVLGGANVLAVQTEAGWELVAFRQATALGDGVWRLSGLLRALQGTETEMRAGAEAGATVVMLDDTLTRLDFRRDERGLPLVFRAGPAGAAPGGAGTTSRIETCRGVHDRPWSPVHLNLRSDGDDIMIRWTPRRRLYGDGWDGDRSLEPGLRFRLRFLDGAVVRRTLEVEGSQAVYTQAERAVDFPGGLGTASVEVSPWGEAWGWGPATRLSMAV